MVASRKITRPLQLVYVLVLCVIVVVVIVITHSNAILPDSVKDSALRGRMVQQRTFAPEIAHIGDEKLGAHIEGMSHGEMAESEENEELLRKAPEVDRPTEPTLQILPNLEKMDEKRAENETAVDITIRPTQGEIPAATMPAPGPVENGHLDILSSTASNTPARHTPVPTSSLTAVTTEVDQVPLLSLRIPLPLEGHPPDYVYEDFVSLEDLYGQYWTSQFASVEEEKEALRMRPSSEQSVAMLNNFHSALRYGQVCSEGGMRDLRRSSSRPRSSSSSSSPSADTFDSHQSIHRAALKEVMSVKTSLFIEFSRVSSEDEASSAAAYTVSASQPHVLSLLFQSWSVPQDGAVPRKENVPCVMDNFPNARHSPSNLLVAQPPPVDSSDTHWRRAMDCSQLVSSLEAIFASDASPLPFDMEEALGWTLCRCNVTILPSKLPTTSFFSYWEDVGMLVAEAVAATGGACEVTVNSTSVHSPSQSSSIGRSPSAVRASPLGSSQQQFVFVYRQYSAMGSMSTLLASTLLSIQLEPRSRTHLVSALVMVSRSAPSMESVLGQMLSWDLLTFPPDRQPTKVLREVPGEGWKKEGTATRSSLQHNSHSSLYASGGSPSIVGDSPVHRAVGGKYSPPSSYRPNRSMLHEGETDAKENDPFTEDLRRSVLTSNVKFASIEGLGNGSMASDSKTAPVSGRRLLTYTYSPGASAGSTSASSSTASTSNVGSSSSIKNPSYSSSGSASRHLPPNATDSVGAASASEATLFREPARRREHPVPALSHSVWTPGSESSRSHVVRSVEDELDRWIGAQVEANHRASGSVDSLGRSVSSSGKGSPSRISKRSAEQLSWTSRLQQKALKGREDRRHYKRWLQLLRGRDELKHIFDSRKGRRFADSGLQYPLVYVFGR